MPDRIAPAGRLAGYVTGGCLFVTGLVYLVVTSRDAMCTHGCHVVQGLAALAWVGALAMTAGGAVIVRSVWRRPVDPNGDTGWIWGLSVIFILGAWLIVSRFPTFTCLPPAHLDPNFALCIDMGAAQRFPATDHTWLKDVAQVISLVVGLTLIRWRRAVWLSAPLAAAAWLIGTGWFLRETLAW